MQLVCKVSNVFHDVRCPICGQGFLVYWTRVRAADRVAGRLELQTTLRGHHAQSHSEGAHPHAFEIPDPAHTTAAPGPWQHEEAAESLAGLYS